MKFDQHILDAAREELVQLFPGICPTGDFAHVGSSYICGEGEDIDIVMYLPKGTAWLVPVTSIGYQFTGRCSGEEDEFQTFRKGPINLMVTDSREFIRDFANAAEVCKYLHKEYGFGDKQTRIRIHRILMNGEDA